MSVFVVVHPREGNMNMNKNEQLWRTSKELRVIWDEFSESCHFFKWVFRYLKATKVRCDFLTCQDPKFPQHILAAPCCTRTWGSACAPVSLCWVFPLSFRKKNRGYRWETVGVFFKWTEVWHLCLRREKSHAQQKDVPVARLFSLQKYTVFVERSYEKLNELLKLEVLLLPGRKGKSGWISLELNCKPSWFLGCWVLLQFPVPKVLPPGKGPGLPCSFSLQVDPIGQEK